MTPFFDIPAHRKARALIFLSGTGSNAVKLLESLASPRFDTWTCAALVTDAPQHSNAAAIAQRFNLPLVAHDARAFYAAAGEKRVSLATEKGRLLREEWTAQLRTMLAPYAADFAILAGFELLSNITNDYPCLNVHPGDLTVERDGQRQLIGLHTRPIEKAMQLNLPSLRSSVIIAGAYSGAGGGMDSGHIIGLSPEVPLAYGSFDTPERVQEAFAARPEKRPVGGYGDVLEKVALANQSTLKEHGDWIVFPPAVADFAAGRFAEEDGTLYFNDNTAFRAVKTVVYTADGRAEMVAAE